MDLAEILKKNSKKLEKLEYENLEMKDCLEKEQGSVKICLECEMLKDKVIFITILLFLYNNFKTTIQYLFAALEKLLFSICSIIYVQ